MLRAALLAAMIAAALESHRAWRRDAQLNGSNERARTHWLDLLAAVGRVVERAGVRIPQAPWLGERLHVRTAVGGLGSDAAVRQARAGGVLVFAAFGLLTATMTGSMVGLAAALGCVTFGWLFPDLWLRAAARARADEIEQQAPLALDLIASAVAAGIPIDDALALAAEVTSGALSSELAVALAHLSLGRRRHAELTDLAARTASPSLRRLASALRTSDRLGVPLAAGLRRQAARARAEESRRIQERAARAAPRILLVVVFVLVPAAMLPVMTALALVAAHSVGPVIGGRL
jgi:tight adherence protein C